MGSALPLVLRALGTHPKPPSHLPRHPRPRSSRPISRSTRGLGPQQLACMRQLIATCSCSTDSAGMLRFVSRRRFEPSSNTNEQHGQLGIDVLTRERAVPLQGQALERGDAHGFTAKRVLLPRHGRCEDRLRSRAGHVHMVHPCMANLWMACGNVEHATALLAVRHASCSSGPFKYARNSLGCNLPILVAICSLDPMPPHCHRWTSRMG